MFMMTGNDLRSHSSASFLDGKRDGGCAAKFRSLLVPASSSCSLGPKRMGEALFARRTLSRFKPSRQPSALK